MKNASNRATIIRSLSEQRTRKLPTQFDEPVSRFSSSSTAKTQQSNVDGQNFGPTIRLLPHQISRLPSLNHIAAPSPTILLSSRPLLKRIARAGPTAQIPFSQSRFRIWPCRRHSTMTRKSIASNERGTPWNNHQV
jgi:hypothetical protein